MKTLCIALCIFAVIVHCYGVDPADDMQSYEECMAEKGLKEDELEKLIEAKDPRLRCIMACIMEKEKILADEKIDTDALKAAISEDIAEIDEKTASELVDYCMNTAKDVKDICDQTNVIGLCIKEQFDKLDIKLKK